jgi:hypothetical protein
METEIRTELSPNIEFLPDEKVIEVERNICKHLTNDEFFSIMWLMRPNEYSFSTIMILFYPMWIEPIKGCWFRREDWSTYSTVDKKPAHRLSYELFIGNWWKGLEICHSCDRKGCFNPWHLFQGTHAQNMKDARNQGKSFFNRNDWWY